MRIKGDILAIQGESKGIITQLDQYYVLKPA